MSEDKHTLTQWYVETIGYDPFTDDPAITVEEVARLKAEYLALNQDDGHTDRRGERPYAILRTGHGGNLW